MEINLEKYHQVFVALGKILIYQILSKHSALHYHTNAYERKADI